MIKVDQDRENEQQWDRGRTTSVAAGAKSEHTHSWKLTSKIWSEFRVQGAWEETQQGSLEAFIVILCSVHAFLDRNFLWRASFEILEDMLQLNSETTSAKLKGIVLASDKYMTMTRWLRPPSPVLGELAWSVRELYFPHIQLLSDLIPCMLLDPCQE